MVIGVDANSSTWHSGPDTGSATSQQTFPTAATAPRGGKWLVVAGLDLAVHWLQPVPRGIRSLAELRAAAAARCAQLHGGQPEDWCVAGDWNVQRDFACAALPGSALQPWIDAAAAHGARLRVETTWTAACAADAAAMPDEGWIGLATPGHAVVWHAVRGHVDCIVHLPLAPATSLPDLRKRAATQVRLARLRMPHLSDHDVHWHSPDLHATPGSQAQAALAWGSRLIESGT